MRRQTDILGMSGIDYENGELKFILKMDLKDEETSRRVLSLNC